MGQKTILIVDDEPNIRDMLQLALESAGYRVITANSAEVAHVLLVDEQPDLMLLDWMMPGLSGIDLMRRIKKNPVVASIPVIMITAKGEEDHLVKGLESGVDDYVSKPFSPRTLLARIKAVMRRYDQGGDGKIVVDELCFDPATHRVTVNDSIVTLGPTEFRLLAFFLEHRERVYSRQQLLDMVWGSNVYLEDRTVDVHIRRLRKALEPFGYDRYVQTVRGAGYRFSSRLSDA